MPKGSMSPDQQLQHDHPQHHLCQRRQRAELLHGLARQPRAGQPDLRQRRPRHRQQRCPEPGHRRQHGPGQRHRRDQPRGRYVARLRRRDRRQQRPGRQRAPPPRRRRDTPSRQCGQHPGRRDSPRLGPRSTTTCTTSHPPTAEPSRSSGKGSAASPRSRRSSRPLRARKPTACRPTHSSPHPLPRRAAALGALQRGHPRRGLPPDGRLSCHR